MNTLIGFVLGGYVSGIWLLVLDQHSDTPWTQRISVVGWPIFAAIETSVRLTPKAIAAYKTAQATVGWAYKTGTAVVSWIGSIINKLRGKNNEST